MHQAGLRVPLEAGHGAGWLQQAEAHLSVCTCVCVSVTVGVLHPNLEIPGLILLLLLLF